MDNWYTRAGSMLLVYLVFASSAQALTTSAKLQRAILNGDAEVALPLIANASLDEILLPDDSQGNSLIHLAAKRATAKNLDGKRRIVNALLSRGADINARNNSGNSVLMELAAWNHRLSDADFAMFKFLLENGAAIDIPNNSGRVLLHHAATGRDHRLISFLVQQKQDPNQPDAKGKTPLMFATERQSVQTIDQLLKLGANLEAATHRGARALHRAAVRKSVLITKHLLDRGAEIDARSNDGQTALSIAASISAWPVAKLLLQRGADPYAKMYDGQTVALHITLNPNLGLGDLVKDANLKNRVLTRRDADAIESLLSKGRIEVLERMGSLGFRFAPNAEGAVALFGMLITEHRMKSIDLERGFHALLKLGADVNHRPLEKRTALGVATFYGNLKLARLLIYNGANPNLAYTPYGASVDTALTDALKGGRLGISELLLDHDAALDFSKLKSWAGVSTIARYAEAFPPNPQRPPQLALQILQRLFSVPQEVSTDLPKVVMAQRKLQKQYPGPIGDLIGRVTLRYSGSKPLPSSVNAKPTRVASSPPRSGKVEKSHTSAVEIPKIPRKTYSPEARLHVIGIYKGASPGEEKPWWANCMDADSGTAALFECHAKYAGARETNPVDVNVSSDGTPLILALMAHDPVEWRIHAHGGVKIEGVILAGYHGQKVTGLPDGVHVEAHTHKPSSCTPCVRSGDYFYTYSETEDREEYSKAFGHLMRLTSKVPQSFQNGYTGREFDITHR